jgi:CBS domain containing-hemolysin-like protein
LNWLRGLRGSKNEEASLRDALEELIEEYDEAEAPADSDERVLIKNVLNLHDLTVEDVMVPRADIVAIEAGTPLDELVKLMSKEAQSRLPVYRETLDDVIGMVHIKDVLACWNAKEAFALKNILRPLLFAAPSMRVLDLLLEMRSTRNHMALIVDEYGGIDGLATIEDLVEEIVGEIEDEHDEEQGPALDPRPDGSLAADARVSIEEFEKQVGPVLLPEEREGIDTLGGLVFSLAGRVPGRGELIAHPSGLEFEVVEADPRRIKRLRVRNLPPAPSQDG